MNPKYPGCKCSICPFADRQFVPPSGPPDAGVLFLGQAPARGEVRDGRPFSGPSGIAFEAALAECGLSRDEVRVDNTILCFFAGGERPPREVVEACRGHVDLETPRAIVPMGNDAAGVVLDTWDGIMRYSGVAIGTPEKSVVPLIHPAFYIRSRPEGFRDFKDGIDLVSRIAKGQTYHHVGSEYRVLTDKDEAIALLEELTLNPPDTLAVDLETDWPDVASAIITCVALAWNETEGVIIPWDSDYLEAHGSDFVGLLEFQDVYDALKAALEANSGVLAYNAPFDACLLKREGIDVYIRDDPLLMHYALDERRGVQGLKIVARLVLGIPDWEEEIKPYTKGGKAYTEIPPEILFKYAAKDACIELALRRHFWGALNRPENAGVLKLYMGEGIFPGLMGYCRMLIDTTTTGVRMDAVQLSKAMTEMPARLRELELELREMVGDRFYNPNSYKDNQHFMFRVLELPKVKGDSTDKDVLEALSGQHPFIDLLVEYRQLLKVCNTYMFNLARAYRAGRGHPDLKLFGSVNGRLTANQLNPLVFPRESRGDLYSSVKKIFIADEGCFLLLVDYSGMEFRIGAILSGDPWMLENLRDPEFDIHTAVAIQMYGDTFLNADAELRKELRVIAKMLVFGLNFGRGPASIAKQLGCSRSKKRQEAIGTWDGVATCNLCDRGRKCQRSLRESYQLVEAYFTPMPVFKWWRESEIQLAHSQGYIETPLGRRRRFDLITRENVGRVRTQGVNTNTQSTANDCNLTAMYRLWAEKGDIIRPLWPVHDAILSNVSLDATPEDIDDILQIIAETPQMLLGTDLPFFLDAEVGFRWGELEKYTGKIPTLEVPVTV